VRAVVQRVAEAGVSIDGGEVAAIGAGLLVLVGVRRDDDEATAARLARRVLTLRLFEDAAARMNLDVAAAGGALLVVPQFTLAAEIGRGRRPGFESVAAPERARALYDRFVAALEAGPVPVRTGRFGARMRIRLVNDGPVTFVLDAGAGDRDA